MEIPVANQRSQVTNPEVAHVEMVSHEKAWQAMDWARQAGHNMFGGARSLAGIRTIDSHC